MWFSLATYGVGAYRDAIESNNQVAQRIAQVIRDSDHLELVRNPMLSIVVFRRKGWTQQQYDDWANKIFEQQIAACFASKYRGEPVFRFAIINPLTTVEVLMDLVERLKDD
jgi:glutamate/tyrosine decarboxylase-like PLP-dependent enzyme